MSDKNLSQPDLIGVDLRFRGCHMNMSHTYYSCVVERYKIHICGRDEVEASNCEFWNASTQGDLVCSCSNEI